MSKQAIQDRYPEQTSHCFGCGYSNPAGHRLKSYWDGAASTASFTPDARYTAIPGYVYGGLIASLIDCHGTATAAAAACQARGGDPSTDALPRFVTAALKVDYRLPTPLGVELVLRGSAREIGERKVVVAIELSAGGKLCATGEVVAVLMPRHLVSGDEAK